MAGETAKPKRSRAGSAERRGPAGTVIRGGKDGPQIVRSSGKRWTEEAAEIFLDALHAGHTYVAAAEACGFSKTVIPRRRRLDPVFAAQCDAARAGGVARLDQLLIAGAEEALEGRPRDPESPLPPMTVHEAMAVVRLYHARPAPGALRRHGAWQPRPRKLEEVKASILAKLSAIARSRGQV